MKGAGIVAAGLVAASLILGLLARGLPATAEKSHAPAPIASGKLITVTVWEKPVQRPGELGSNSSYTMEKGRVDVYDQFIILTSNEGKKTVCLHGWYTNLRFEQD